MKDKFEKIVIGLQIILGIIAVSTLVKLLVKLFIYTWF